MRKYFPDFCGILLWCAAHLLQSLAIDALSRNEAGIICANCVLQSLPVVYANLAPGDCIMFHGNTLHHSDPNESEYKRWNLIFR